MESAERERTIVALIDEQVAAMLGRGHPIRDLAAFRAEWRRRIEANQRTHAGFLDAARRRLDGTPLPARPTGCREVRGSHGIDYIADPAGTDSPPAWWNRDEAEAIAARRRARRRAPAEA